LVAIALTNHILLGVKGVVGEKGVSPFTFPFPKDYIESTESIRI